MKKILGILLGVFLLGLSGTVFAIPTLQLYIDGSTYDTATETWVYAGGNEFDLWAIGADNQSDTTITSVKLAAAVGDGGQGYGISISELGASNLITPSFFTNAIPVLGDGSFLSQHGIYPSDYFEFNLGDFVLIQNDIPNFNQDYGTENEDNSKYGLIKKYHVVVTGYDSVHFDLYDHIEGGNKTKYYFAPFSHDAESNHNNPVPEPATMLLLGSGLIGLAGFGRKKFKK